MYDNLDPLAAQILQFWFGADATDEAVNEDKQTMWFRDGAAYDELVRATFGDYLDCAAAGAFDHWCDTPRGTLAVLVLTDQFPRHVHRGTPRAFATDAKAREVCLRGLKREQDRALTPIERVVFYLPLEHAEDIVLQERCVSMYQQLSYAVSEAARGDYEMNTGYAVAHRDIIVRFGYFPHRSKCLGRTLSAQEEEFLTQPNASF
jgi:uncharacterized protein (DUF924 family)